jgi:predicted nucleotidyltransferase
MNEKIKEIIKETLKDYTIEKIILFGSRARGDNNKDSDYDVLVILKEDLEREQLYKLTSITRKDLAELLIPIDILIRPARYVDYMKNKIGNVISYATEEGIEI